MGNNSSPNVSDDIGVDAPADTKRQAPSFYNPRSCPQCGALIFGMPGGRDAQCTHCGYKDPCCSD